MNNVKDFGAAGDGVTRDTTAIQKAIDAGGMVFFPPGVYLSGTLYLKSNGGLELAPGAILKASPDRTDYNADDFCPQNRVFAMEKVSGAHFITAVEQHNIVIRGSGRIDGHREAFMNEPHPQYDHVFQWPEWRPGQMIFLCECENVTLTDVELYNTPYWTCFLHGCEHVNIRGLRIYNDQRTHNGDGIDIDCCRFVTVSDCIIDSGDDCITLRGYSAPLKNPKPCEYVTITNCLLHTRCNAFRIGVGNGLVRFCTISNIIIHHSRTAICFVSQYSERSEGVGIEDISMSNLLIEAERAIVVKTHNLGPQDQPLGKPIRRISFNHLRGTVTRGSYITGNRGNPVCDVTFADVELVCAGEGDHLNAGEDRKKYIPVEYEPSAFYLENTERVRFDRVGIQWQNDSPNWKYGVSAVYSPDTETTCCRFGKPNSIHGKVS